MNMGNVPATSLAVNFDGYPDEGIPTAVPPLESEKLDGFLMIFRPLPL
jgi:hypothetical protein